MALIHLDGSTEEGGGQILRTAVALSAVTGIPFEITDIRKNRPKPGLKQQHLYGVKAAAELCNADMEGLELGSPTIKFMPRSLAAKNISVLIETAGSMTLVLQSVLLPALFCKKTIYIKMTGGSDVSWSPSFDYMKEVFIPTASFLGSVHLRLSTRGYYPAGGGKAEVVVHGKHSFDELSEIPEISIDDDFEFAKVAGVSHASLDLAGSEVSERQANSARVFLGKMPFMVDIQTSYSKTPSTGSGITLWAYGITPETRENESRKFVIGADALGEKGRKAEDVGKDVAQKLIAEMKSRACVDAHLADMLIPLLGLAGGRMRVSEITPHVKANIYVTEKFLPVKFKIEEAEDGKKTISCGKPSFS